MALSKENVSFDLRSERIMRASTVLYIYFSDGTGYVDDGREIFDDDLEEEPSSGQLIVLTL